MLPPAHTSRVRGRAGVVVARRMTSSARLKFLCRSSISAHSHHTVARSSTYFRRACRGRGGAGGKEGTDGWDRQQAVGFACEPRVPACLARQLGFRPRPLPLSSRMSPASKTAHLCCLFEDDAGVGQVPVPLVQLGKGDPQGVGFARGLVAVNRLDSLCSRQGAGGGQARQAGGRGAEGMDSGGLRMNP